MTSQNAVVFTEVTGKESAGDVMKLCCGYRGGRNGECDESDGYAALECCKANVILETID